MKKTIVNKSWQLAFTATLLFFGFGALLHIALLLLQALAMGKPFPLGLISILGLEFFFPQLKSGLLESALSIFVYCVCILMIYRFLKTLHITLEKKTD